MRSFGVSLTMTKSKRSSSFSEPGKPAGGPHVDVELLRGERVRERPRVRGVPSM
jgi:hypothetical protein